jgi:hypothetical protein
MLNHAQGRKMAGLEKRGQVEVRIEVSNQNISKTL